VDTLLTDLRYGLRLLRRQPGFTVIAVLALGLGIGVNTAVFTGYRAMVTRPLDARDPAEMVNLALTYPQGATRFTFSAPDYEAYRNSLRSCSGLVAFANDRLIVSDTGSRVRSGIGRPETAYTFLVSENYFEVLGVEAVRGRTFDARAIADLIASPSVLISENYWQKRFGGDPSILGRTVHLNGAAVTVMGVTPRNFIGTGVAAPDFWVPMTLAPLVYGDAGRLRDRENARYRLFGRLAPGASVSQAGSEMTIVADRLRALHDPHGPSARQATALVWPGSPFPLPLSSYPGITLAILFVMASAAMVLIVACANVGSLQLARGRSRLNELHTRVAVGATRSRVIRQLLTESALLGILAGLAAFSLTWVLLKVGVTVIGGMLPPGNGALVFDVTPDMTIFAYVFAVSSVAGILFGLAPAVESSRSALEIGTRSSTPPSRSRRIQDILIAVQVGLSVVLLIVGSLMIRGAFNSITTDPGYDHTRLVRLGVEFPETSAYSADRRDALIRELRGRLTAAPGVVAITNAQPPAVAPFQTAAIALERDATMSPAQLSILHYAYVEANYFQTVGIRLASGRAFAADGSDGGVILSESAARQLWPGQDAIGRRLRLGVTDQRLSSVAEFLQRPTELLANGPAYDVIGVVRDTRGAEFDGTGTRQVYLPMRGTRYDGYPILIRTQSDPAELINAIDVLIASLDTDIIGTASFLGEAYRQSPPFLISTIAAVVSSTVGVFGLLLASMGIYGTVSYLVLHRTREIGIRMALGARARDVLGMILRDSTRPVTSGVVAGLMVAAGVSSLLRGVLYGVRTIDAVSFVGVSVLLFAVALLAAYAPARRAATVEPTVALRYE
jgi:macrolide transport system ATP-binding/permease protein